MKKALILLMVLLLGVSYVFAVDPPTGAVQGSDKKTGDGATSAKAYLTATFDMTSSDNSSVTIGFLKQEDSDIRMTNDPTDEQIAKEIALTANGDTATASYTTSYLGVFYQIQYGSPLTVSISLGNGTNDDLVLSTADETLEDTQKLGWQVSVEDSSDPSNSTVSSSSYTGHEESDTDAVVYTHNGETYTSAGAKKISVVTDNYSGKDTGSYVGYIVASVSAN